MVRVAVVTLVAVAGASKVHCPGFSEGVCNCADDCSANANLCACAEARHCCDASSTTPWDGAVWEASVSMAAGETGRPIGAAFSDAAGATKLVVAKNKKVDVYTGAADASAATVERTYALDFLCETPSHFPVTLSGVEDRDVLMTLAGTGPLCDCIWSEGNKCPQHVEIGDGRHFAMGESQTHLASQMPTVTAGLALGVSAGDFADNPLEAYAACAAFTRAAQGCEGGQLQRLISRSFSTRFG